MRKRRNVVFGALILAVLAALVLSLSACAKKQTATASLEPYTTGWDGAVYTITPIDAYKGTISDGTNTYSYRYDTSGSSYGVTFTYPDGETYRCTQNGSTSSGAAFSSGSASLDFDFDKYPDGMTLDRVLKRSPAAKHEEKSTKSWGVILLLLFVGCFMETLSALLILMPVLLPIAGVIGMNTIQFGVMCVLNLVIGLCTPPVGVCLATACGIGEISLSDGTKGIAPFYLCALLVLILVAAVPEITVWLPTLILG